MKAAVIFVMCAVAVGTIYSQGPVQQAIQCGSCYDPVCGGTVLPRLPPFYDNVVNYECYDNQDCMDIANSTGNVYPANMSSCWSVFPPELCRNYKGLPQCP